MNQHRGTGILTVVLAAVSAMGTSASAIAQQPPASSQGAAAKVLRLLASSGYQYKQFTPVVWAIDFEGKSIGSFKVIVTTREHLVVIFTVLAKKAQVPLTIPLMQALLRANSSFDRVKIGFDDDGDLVVRSDLSARILDQQELKDNAEQVAAASNELYEQIAPSLKK